MYVFEYVNCVKTLEREKHKGTKDKNDKMLRKKYLYQVGAVPLVISFSPRFNVGGCPEIANNK
jgi:hypothetical protein